MAFRPAPCVHGPSTAPAPPLLATLGSLNTQVPLSAYSPSTHGPWLCGNIALSAAPCPPGHTLTPEMEAPRPGQVCIHSPDSFQLMDTRQTGLLVYVGCRQRGLENSDHFNLLYPARLLYSPGTFLKCCKAVLIFLFFMWDKKTES